MKDNFNYLIGDKRNSHLWNSLNQDEIMEVLVAYEESFEKENILTHEEVKHQHTKWLNHKLD